MIRASRRQGLQGHAREQASPAGGDKDHVDALKSRMRPLITPCKQATMEVQLLKLKIIVELSKTTHHPLGKAIIIFIMCLVNQVEVPTQNPRPDQGGTNIAKFLQESNLLCVLLRPVYVTTTAIGSVEE